LFVGMGNYDLIGAAFSDGGKIQAIVMSKSAIRTRIGRHAFRFPDYRGCGIHNLYALVLDGLMAKQHSYFWFIRKVAHLVNPEIYFAFIRLGLTVAWGEEGSENEQ